MLNILAVETPSRFLFGFELEGQRDSMYGKGKTREEAELAVKERLQRRFPLAELPDTLEVIQGPLPC